MWSSGFSTSTPLASDTSAPVTALGPLASSRVSVGSPDGTFTASFFRFSSTSVRVFLHRRDAASPRPSRPGSATHATAEPGTMASRVRRRECPTVRA